MRRAPSTGPSHHDSAAAKRHTSAHAAAVLRLALAAGALALAACGGNIVTPAQGGGGTGAQTTIVTTSTNNDPHPFVVPCDSAKDGDPCASPGESCGATECWGCFTQCVGTHWSVTCSDPPACSTMAPPQLSPCDIECGGPSCGPYLVMSSCGTEDVVPDCTLFGWRYPIACKPDCAALDTPTCNATIGCAWVSSCDTSPDAVSGCFPFDFSLQGCSGVTCPAGQTCHTAYVNPDALDSGDCSSVSAMISLCTN